jgi:GNAT superfamily N-acetyltransferase
MTTRMSLLSLPSASEALLYVRNNGLRRSIAKAMTGYIAGRQRWYMTREDLTRYVGQTVEESDFEYRFARRDDVPRMEALTRRMSPGILALWCGADYYFFLTLRDGQPVSYRCLSRLVHPGVVGFVRLRSDQIFMVDEYTVPEFRRRGITRQMAIAMAPLLLELGYREVLGIHRTDNHDTVAAARAKGIPRIGTVTRTCLLWRITFSYEPAVEIGTLSNVAEDNIVTELASDTPPPSASILDVEPTLPDERVA